MNKKRWLVIVGIVAAVVVLAIVFDMMLANHRPAITSLEAEPERVIPSGICQITCTALDRDGDELSYNWSAGGGEINQITITARYNKPPYIISLVADAVWTLPSGSIQVTCDAEDPDGDELNYEWSTTVGNISGTGPEVTWTAPQEVGIYHVTVVVKDGHGEEDTRSVTISVATGTPPTIEDLIVTAKEPKYLKEGATGDYDYKVGRTKEYDIECIVSDTSGGVSYNWSCEDGEISEISEDDSMITWVAPDYYVQATQVTVIVSDVADNMVSDSIVFYVVSCTYCHFG